MLSENTIETVHVFEKYHQQLIQLIRLPPCAKRACAVAIEIIAHAQRFIHSFSAIFRTEGISSSYY